MTISRVAVAGSILVASIVSACAAVSHVGALQPPSEASYSAAHPTALHYVKVPAPHWQLGIGVDFYTYPGQDIAAASKKTVAYAKSLHANSLSISFPYFMRGRHASSVFATRETPSPADLAIVASVAENAGLYVSLRPLLDDYSLGASRTAWKPDHLAAWMASYQRFLLPYAEMAQQTRIPELIEGAEFSMFGSSRRWNGLVAAIRTVYRGAVVYDNNWGIPLAGNGGRGVQEGVDSYQPMRVKARATTAQLTAAWSAYDRTLPRGTVELEVDIAAVRGAYTKPFQVTQWKEHRLVPSVQVRWFTAACDAMVRENLGGIYFWGVGLGQSTSTPPGLADPGSWVDSPGARAISACFRKLVGQ
jgi:hypothetical protein